MYQFLYLFAPGVLSWLVSMRGRQADGEQMEKEGILLAAAKVIAFSMLDLTAVAVILKPFGRMQFVVLPDGTLTVDYGVSALAVATAAAVVTGMCAAAVKKRAQI